MTVQELNMKLDDYQLEIFKYVVIDIIVIIATLRITDIIQLLNVSALNAIAVAAVLLLCVAIATFDRIDHYNWLKEQKRMAEEELEIEKTA